MYGGRLAVGLPKRTSTFTPPVPSYRRGPSYPHSRSREIPSGCAAHSHAIHTMFTSFPHHVPHPRLDPVGLHTLFAPCSHIRPARIHHTGGSRTPPCLFTPTPRANFGHRVRRAAMHAVHTSFTRARASLFPPSKLPRLSQETPFTPYSHPIHNPFTPTPTARSQRMLDYLGTVSPLSTLVVLFLLVFPPVFYFQIFVPCWECFDFE
eukprot:scaffold33231_cov107-Isochrysis_galbana.AAC.1